jgi:hypothetical protein
MQQADNSTHRDQVTYGLKVTREWSDWLSRLSEATRLPRPVLVDHALGEYARQRNLEEPPRRVPVRR